jgi:hypothetical protein
LGAGTPLPLFKRILMTALTNVQLQTEIHRNHANRGDFTVGAGSILETYLNFAQDRLARLFRFDELKKYSKNSLSFTGDVDVDRFLPLPTDFRAGYSLALQDDTSSHRVTYISPQKWDQLIPRVEERARRAPVHFTLFGLSNLEFWPLPDEPYEVRFRWEKWPTNLTTANQVTEFIRKDDLLIDLGTSIAYLSKGNTEKSLEFFKVFSAKINTIIEDAKHDAQKEIVPEFELSSGINTEYWLDPFVRFNP